MKKYTFYLYVIIQALLLASSSYCSQEEKIIDYILDPIVIIGNRSESPLFYSTNAVTVITEKELKNYSSLNISEVLEKFSGINFYNLDGMHNDPIPIVRGFFGGGEVESLYQYYLK